MRKLNEKICEIEEKKKRILIEGRKMDEKEN